ncbi:MFS general substrate transporter [Dendrothele bispora CBS 962.96]|uniref:MFS general substrate transporter n=1 Tax=Dendrothele bispora (strain CBS 962.96) TaxID=1314807 RepID=A0A4S8MW58_DENBC|nr:MFS general substrate transporter [Dendrothele bispora CBS 962.96]
MALELKNLSRDAENPLEAIQSENRAPQELAVVDGSTPRARQVSSVKDLAVDDADGPIGLNSSDVVSELPRLSFVNNVVQPTRSQLIKKRIHFAAFCWGHFMLGWNDGSAGPLLPRIQEVYQISFVVASLIFVCTCIGFLIGAMSNVYLSEKMKFGKILVLGGLAPLVAYVIQAPALPFPVFILSFALSGGGVALQHAQANGYVATLDHDPSTRLSIFHAAYGLGAFTAPLVATQFAQMRRWSFHYLVSLGVGGINLVLMVLVFKLRSKDECRKEIGLEPTEKGTSDRSAFRQIFALKSVHTMAAFTFMYVGTEWLDRNIHNPTSWRRSGLWIYISSGFFGGLMLGRILLLPLNKLLGLRRVVMLYGVLSIGLEFIIWFTPSLIGNGIAVSITGMLLGPVYPLAISLAGSVIPKWLLTGSIGWIAGFGQAGGAALPFVTGAIADGVGIGSLQPLLVAMMCVMIGLWVLIPKSRRAD